MSERISSPIELVLNGDIFDFDSITQIPENPPFSVSWLERKRGLHAEEAKSRYKLSLILNDHKVWFDAIREFILRGNTVVFIIGNHDIELQWPSVQQDLLAWLSLPDEYKNHLRFCEWFYVSGTDTLIEHSNQYDVYCVRPNPIHPLVKKGSHILMRIPFGNLAGRFMTNGMGLINPHADSNFIMSLRQWLVFFYRVLLRVQPTIPWAWFWGATVTLVYSFTEALMPSLKDPLTVESRVEEIAKKANATPHIVRALLEMHVHPATFNPIQIMKELWLDRAFLLMLIFFVSFGFFSVINVFIQVSFWWFAVPFFILFPVFIFYARSVRSHVGAAQEAATHFAPFAAQIARVSRVVHGHTHQEKHLGYEGIDLINTGTWSPAYLDLECTKPYGRKCFAWIRPNDTGSGRVGELFEWRDPGMELIRKEKKEDRKEIGQTLHE